MSCSPRLTRCSVDCRHRQFVMDYRQERHRTQQAAVEASNGYEAEPADYLEAQPLPTFRDWLVGSKRPVEGWDMPATAFASGPELEL
jgi:hypothetical protein